MQIITGPVALTSFRINQLLPKLRQITPFIQSVTATYLHVHETVTLSDAEHHELQELLSYEAGSVDHFTPEGQVFYVMPRPGTISPWSSKASDIIHNAGLHQIKRIERVIAYDIIADKPLKAEQQLQVAELLHDRMTQIVVHDIQSAAELFSHTSPHPVKTISLSDDGQVALEQANLDMGLALSTQEISYLHDYYQSVDRDPTDAELMMFAQINSEHCRHKIFNAEWTIDGIQQEKSLFAMIKNTYEHAPENVVTAYSDNSSVINGWSINQLELHPETQQYRLNDQRMDILMKVETHNHPTAISPFAGAATGAGGEIRDEAATGRGSKTKAGLCGFTVSNLRIPAFTQPWEVDAGRPEHIASALDIMLDAPIGAAAFNNEFGRPNIVGYFRTYEEIFMDDEGKEPVGYVKPIMIAGGMGNIRHSLVKKQLFQGGEQIIVLGGPAMLIGLGGGAASSMATTEDQQDLDYASVQRGNPEMQRRAQEVIDRCSALGEDSPILSIHDVGAGGISNALPELVDDGGKGALFELRQVLSDEPGMSPREIWSNESQERFVLAINRDRLAQFEAICQRERCPMAVVGEATETMDLVVNDRLFNNQPVNMPLSVLLGQPPRLQRNVRRQAFTSTAFYGDGIDLRDAVRRVLQLPSVASKAFLINIGDRTVGGLTARDQMVGPWQMPVADVGVTLSDYDGFTGEAMAMGERPVISLVKPPASGRMAIGEALTNIMAAPIDQLSDIKLSANWMAAAGQPGQDAALFDTVRAVGEELCPELGIAIPVGKDSLSMQTEWTLQGVKRSVTSPLTLIVSAFAPVSDVRQTLTPELDTSQPTDLYLIDLSNGRFRLGGSALAQVYNQLGHEVPDFDDTQLFKSFFNAIKNLREHDLLLAYHDRSDGGLFTTLCEMAFAAKTGLTVEMSKLKGSPLQKLFNEELGVVIQTPAGQRDQVKAILDHQGVGHVTHYIGQPNDHDELVFEEFARSVFIETRNSLLSLWHETSYQMQKLRDNADCAEWEKGSITDTENKGLFSHLTFELQAPAVNTRQKPRIAILREQGVNGHYEMAAAFTHAGFEAVDVHMTDLINQQTNINDFEGLTACGGFSYGDVLGAGGGWAKTILFNDGLRSQFERFFTDNNKFGLGVCNGCQMMSQLKTIIPGAQNWPQFLTNTSEQFEARLSMVQINQTNSLFFKGMEGSQLPVVVSHGEGRAVFKQAPHASQIALQYIDYLGNPTEHFPANPNGSTQGITALCNEDGRFTIMMPHPERIFRSVQMSWSPNQWGPYSPWMQLFYNVRSQFS